MMSDKYKSMVHQSHLPSAGHLSAEPFINNCYSEMCMSSNAVAPSHEKKLGWVVAAIFIVADMVGGGVVAMPVAFKQSGLFWGVVFMLVICIVFQYTGYQLGRVWCKMMERNPHIGVCRKPFPEMAKRTMGPMAQRFTSVMGNVTLFGISVVYLLLSSKILHYFAGRFTSVPITNCMVIVILAAVILPFTFLKSPGDFWGVIVIAMVTTVVAVLAILLGVGLDAGACYPNVNYPEQNMNSIMLSLGVFLFAFSGHFVFPSIQHDMKKPEEFTKSVTAGFALVVLLYMPLSVFGYVVYGDTLNESIIYSIQTSWLQLAANLMIAVHCIMTLVIVINPLNQEVEHYLKISHGFGTGRIVTRTVVLLVVLFMSLSVPNFTPVLNLVGAATIPVGCVILPSLFYLWCEAATEDEYAKGNFPSFKQVCARTDKTVLIINFIILAMAVCGSLWGTYLGIENIIKAEFSTPCYLQSFMNQDGPKKAAFEIRQSCCGEFRNISTYFETCPAVIIP